MLRLEVVQFEWFDGTFVRRERVKDRRSGLRVRVALKKTSGYYDDLIVPPLDNLRLC